MENNVKKDLYNLLANLGEDDLKHFQWILQNPEFLDGAPPIKKSRLEKADISTTIDLMVDLYTKERAMNVAKLVLEEMKGGKFPQAVPENPLASATAEALNRCQPKLKSNLRRKFQCVFEGVAKAGNPALLNKIYTELYITEGATGEVNNDHEIRQIETASRKAVRPKTTIKLEDMFKASPGREEPIRRVMTKGVAGIGKTVLTQKFTLDWAEDEANEDIQFTFLFTFRELNVLKERKFSLVELVHHFFTETKEAGICRFEEFQVLFIFDGLDECRLPLDFHKTEILTDVRESTSVDVLLTNLIRGNLFPSARLWITTRPSAANQIPPQCVSMVTEVRGFTDQQKEEYFRKRFRDEEQASRIISHIKTSQSLYIMCYIPVFCWMTATVLEDIVKSREGGELPKALTEMYIYFLVVQCKLKNVKYDGGTETDPHWTLDNIKMIESLGKLAFEQLQKRQLIFYESDLTECGIDINAASLYSGVFTQIFKEERGLYQDKVFCFIHLSVQEFLAALHVHLTFFKSGVNLLSQDQSTSQTYETCGCYNKCNSPGTCFYKSAVDKALQYRNGHLDLFLRFLLGLSLQTNQTLLQCLLTETESSSQTNKETVQYIKEKIEETPSTEKKFNLFHCLSEMKDHSLVEEIQQYLNSESPFKDKLSPVQWSSLLFQLISSEKELDVFNPVKYSSDFSEQDILFVLEIVKYFKKAVLSGCELSKTSCEKLSSVLSSQSSTLKELDLSNNNLEDSGVKLLSAGLQSRNCSLEILRLSGCNLSERSCGALSSVLSSQSSSLGELDLSNNKLQDAGVTQLSTGLRSPHCTLKSLRLAFCNLSERSYKDLSPVLSTKSSSLKELDLSNNDLQESRLKSFSTGLRSSPCTLETLRLRDCNLSERSCEALSLLLSYQSSNLREMDLTNNNLHDSGVKLLSAGMESPHCKLEILRLSGCLITEKGCVALATALISNPSHVREVDLSYNHVGDSGVKLMSAVFNSPHWRLDTLSVEPDEERWLRPGLRKYFCQLAIDTNTVNRKLQLSENNSKVTLMSENQSYPDHPDRFDYWYQLLCSNGLTGRCYWEVKWYRSVHISVSYGDMSTKGNSDECWFGRNNRSWTLECSDHRNNPSYSFWHNNKQTIISSPDLPSGTKKVAVYVDHPAGTLSFYKVVSDKLIHLHTFNTTFTEPLYPGFGFTHFWYQYIGNWFSLCPE